MPPSPPPPRHIAPGTLVDELNARFHRSPFGSWPADGTLDDTGVLIHCIDGFEDHSKWWIPGHNMPAKDLISGSLLFRDMHVPGNSVPLFTCKDGGIILRPGLTKVVCGHAGDAGGQCTVWCPKPSAVGKAEGRQYPGDGCGNAWRPADFGVYLQRTVEWQRLYHRAGYNEILIAAQQWRSAPAQHVETFFEVSGQGSGQARAMHAAFVQAHGLDRASAPFVQLAPWNWERPWQM